MPFDPELKLNYRVGALGQREYAVPAGREHEFLNAGAAATTYGDRTFIAERFYGDPEIARHEAIHVAQSHQKAQPPLKDVLTATGLGGDAIGANRDYPEQEVPANALSGKRDPQTQRSYDGYLDLLRKTDPENASDLEVAVDPEVAKDNIKRVPPPHKTPKVPMKAMGLKDLLLGAK